MTILLPSLRAKRSNLVDIEIQLLRNLL